MSNLTSRCLSFQRVRRGFHSLVHTTNHWFQQDFSTQYRFVGMTPTSTLDRYISIGKTNASLFKDSCRTFRGWYWRVWLGANVCKNSRDPVTRYKHCDISSRSCEECSMEALTRIPTHVLSFQKQSYHHWWWFLFLPLPSYSATRIALF